MAEDKISRKMERIQAIREQLVSLLPEENMTSEQLIRALGQICPEKNEEELEQACKKMKAGIENGAAEIRYYTELGDVDALLREKLDECTKNLSAAQKKGFLMSLYQIMHKDFAYADMTGEMAMFLAELPEEEMKEGLHQLLKGEAGILAARETEELLKAAEEALTEEKQSGGEKWTKEEQWMVTAASIYAASVSGEIDGQLALYPQVIGQDVGAQGQAVTELACLGEERTAEAAETILLVLEILALLVVFYTCCFGLAAFADILYQFLIAESASTALIVLYSVGLAMIGTAGTMAVMWGVAEAFEKLQVFTAEKAVPRVHAFFRNLRERMREKKEEARRQSRERQAEYDEYDEFLEENWAVDEEESAWL